MKFCFDGSALINLDPKRSVDSVEFCGALGYGSLELVQHSFGILKEPPLLCQCMGQLQHLDVVKRLLEITNRSDWPSLAIISSHE